jgi:hypothetical protein
MQTQSRHAIRDAHGRFRRDVNAEVVAELHERLRRETRSLARKWLWAAFALLCLYGVAVAAKHIMAVVVG